jgi:hypothetical protein
VVALGAGWACPVGAGAIVEPLPVVAGGVVAGGVVVSVEAGGGVVVVPDEPGPKI